jgi:hypothetical protein
MVRLSSALSDSRFSYSKIFSKLHDTSFETSVRDEFDVSTGYVQRRVIYEHSVFLTPDDLRYFAKKLPHVVFRPKSRLSPEEDACVSCVSRGVRCNCLTSDLFFSRGHSHPRLHLDREFAENLSISMLRSYAHRVGVTIDEQCPIVDIGGNPSRHRSKGRTFLHSCNPVLSAPDVLRTLKHSGAPNSCSHLASACKCVVPAAYLSVDSLYYLSPSQIYSAVRRATSHLLIAVTHTFPEAFGTLAEGEASYFYTSADSVEMTVKGNNVPYTHSSLSWLNQGHISFGDGSLCWSLEQETADHHIYLFTCTDIVFPSPTITSSPFSSSLTDSNYYGKVLVGPLHDQDPSINVPGELQMIDSTTLISVGSFFVIHAGQRRALLCPKDMVACGQAYVACRPREKPATFSLLFQWMRHQSRKLNIPPQLLADCLFGVTALAFVRDLKSEIEILHATVEPVAHLLPVHTAALNFKFHAVWKWWKSVIVGLGAAVVTSLPAATQALLALPVTPALGIAPAVCFSAAITAVLLEGLARWRARRQRYRATVAAKEAYANYPLGEIVTEPAAFTIKPMSFPGVPPSRSLEEVLAAPIDSQATLEIPDPLAFVDSTRVHPAGITCRISPPVASENSAHATVAALKRQLRPQAFHGEDDRKTNEQYNNYEFDKFLAWARKNRAHMYPNFRHGTQYNDSVFNEWNSKNPAWKQKIYETVRDDLVAGLIRTDRTDVHQTFTKIEAQLKSTPAGVVDFDPRCIQGCDPVRNCITAPWVYAFTKYFKAQCDWHKSRGLVFASGISDAVEYASACRAVFEDIGFCKILEGDFSKFDWSLHQRWMEFEAEMFRDAGMPAAALQECYNSVRNRGKAKHGIKYSVAGTRSSGDPQTSVGNTMLQHFALLYAICMSTGYSADRVLRECRLDACGDDSLSFVPENYNTSHVKEILSRLGFKFKLKEHTGPTAFEDCTILSCHFYPVEDVLTEEPVWVLAPNLGRQIARFGWYVNPPPGVPLNSLIRGDMIGRHPIYRAIPFLRELVFRSLELTDKDTPYNAKTYMVPTQRVLRPSDATYAFVERYYGLTRLQEEQYRVLLQSVPSMPAVVDFPGMATALASDGLVDYLVENFHDGCPPDDPPKVNGTPVPLPQPWTRWVPKGIRPGVGLSALEHQVIFEGPAERPSESVITWAVEGPSVRPPGYVEPEDEPGFGLYARSLPVLRIHHPAAGDLSGTLFPPPSALGPELLDCEMDSVPPTKDELGMFERMSGTVTELEARLEALETQTLSDREPARDAYVSQRMAVSHIPDRVPVLNFKK